MDVRITTLSAAHIAYHRHTGPYGAAVGQFWQCTVVPWMVANSLVGRPRYGISLDDPAHTPPQQCRYDACVEVPRAAVLTGTAERTTLPGGLYAVHDFKGRSAQITSAWSDLMQQWLPRSGLQLDDRPFFEYYGPDAQFDEATGVFTCQICVPVVASGASPN